MRHYQALLHSLSGHRNVLLLVGSEDGRSWGEQVLLGFQGCFYFLCLGGALICWGFRLGFLYILVLQRQR